MHRHTENTHDTHTNSTVHICTVGMCMHLCAQANIENTHTHTQIHTKNTSMPVHKCTEGTHMDKYTKSWSVLC